MDLTIFFSRALTLIHGRIRKSRLEQILWNRPEAVAADATAELTLIDGDQRTTALVATLSVSLKVMAVRQYTGSVLSLHMRTAG
jgi:hypothetical protein